MTLTTDVVAVACNTSGATQTITSLSLGGDEPVLVFFLVVGTTAESNANDAILSYGCTDGTNQWVLGFSSEHNTSRTDAYRWFKTDKCVLVMNANDGTVDGEASISSLGDVSQVVLSWSTLPSSAWKMIVWAVAGSSASAVVGTDSHAGGSIGSTHDVAHGLSSAPTAIWGAMAGTGTVRDAASASAGARISIGYGSYDGSNIGQACSSLYVVDSAGTSQQVYGMAHEEMIAAPTYKTGGTPDPAEPWLEFSGVDGVNVEFTKRNAFTAVPFGYAFLAGGKAFAGMWEFPTGTGDAEFDLPASAADFSPVGMMFGSTRLDYSEEGQIRDNNRVPSMGWSFIGEDGTDFTSSVQHERNAINTDTQSYHNDRALNLPPHTGGTGGQRADWSSWDSDGVTLNVTNGLGATKCLPLILVGAPDASPPDMGQFRGRVAISAATNGRVVSSGVVAGLVASSGAKCGRIVGSSPARGRVSTSLPLAGRVVSSAPYKGHVVVSGLSAGRVVASGVTAGRVAASQAARGRVVSSGPARGRVAISGVAAGRIVSSA